MSPTGRTASPSTALALRPVNYGGLARTTLAQFGNRPTEFGDPALNRIRVLSGLAPLAMRDDGTIDLSDDPLLYQFAVAGPFAE